MLSLRGVRFESSIDLTAFLLGLGTIHEFRRISFLHS